MVHLAFIYDGICCLQTYSLVPLLLAFVCLAVIRAASVLFAVLQRILSLAIIACIGEHLAPILLLTKRGNL